MGLFVEMPRGRSRLPEAGVGAFEGSSFLSRVSGSSGKETPTRRQGRSSKSVSRVGTSRYVVATDGETSRCAEGS